MPSPGDSKAVAGLLLTGGASRRMGVDKARIRVDGEPLAVRLGRLLAGVAEPAYEIGPGHSGLAVVAESAPGSGPLTALADGVARLDVDADADAEADEDARPRPVIVLSCDLPQLDQTALQALASWPGRHSVIPLWHGRPQPLCARWSAVDLAAVAAMMASGERSLRALLARPGIELTDALGDAVADADTPEELDALGVSWQRP